MIRIFALAFFALNVLVSCVSSNSGGSRASTVSTEPYQPASKPEKIEFVRDRLDVYPEDVRKDLAAHSGHAVVWAGIIRSTFAQEEDMGDKITADTVFEQHYFDWVQNNRTGGIMLSLSPRGEGLFRARWRLDKLGRESSADGAEKYAAPGKLAIFYGVPEKVETNGTVVLKYRYLRILGPDHFNTNEFDYGRLGSDSFCVLNTECKTNAPAMKGH
jgi:hypothetical protein